MPAFIWVVVGTIFFAGVHDFGAIWASVRNKAQSVGSLTGEVVSHRARTLFMIVVFFLLLMVNAVFAVSISAEHVRFLPVSSRLGLLSSSPWSLEFALKISVEIYVANIIGPIIL
ncbi:MAG: hypothetical protein Ct9H300mP25_09140 [Acidobacteriota bacterium]|nr:MAG: hypothetical protein Ct9H300mP25_09140 [Acidobacteriota bacterium]